MFTYDENEDASTQPVPVFFLCLFFVKTYSVHVKYAICDEKMHLKKKNKGLICSNCIVLSLICPDGSFRPTAPPAAAPLLDIRRSGLLL